MAPNDPIQKLTRTLTAEPSLTALYARSLLRRPRPAVDFPRTRVVRAGARFDVDRLAEFCRSTGFPVRDTVPLPFPHLLGFPLQVELLVREAFPFTLLGLVHLEQTFEQTRPLPVAEGVDLAVRAVGMQPHRRGATVDLLTEVRTAGSAEVVWSGRSRYLARGVRMPGAARDPGRLPAPELSGAGTSSTLWRVPADTGRVYAAVSGDVNPLHLSRASARLLGFRRALAHGMWTASRSLAALGALPAGAARYQVGFGAPLLLPATVRHVVQPVPGGWATAVRSRDGATVHLAGHLAARLTARGGVDVSAGGAGAHVRQSTGSGSRPASPAQGESAEGQPRLLDSGDAAWPDTGSPGPGEQPEPVQ